MPLLRLQPVDCQQDLFGVVIKGRQFLRILMSRRDHVLIRGNVIFNGIIGQFEVVAVPQLIANLRHGPVP